MVAVAVDAADRVHLAVVGRRRVVRDRGRVVRHVLPRSRRTGTALGLVPGHRRRALRAAGCSDPQRGASQRRDAGVRRTRRLPGDLERARASRRDRPGRVGCRCCAASGSPMRTCRSVTVREMDVVLTASWPACNRKSLRVTEFDETARLLASSRSSTCLRRTGASRRRSRTARRSRPGCPGRPASPW